MKGEYQGLKDPRLVHMTAAGKKLFFQFLLGDRDGGLCGICGDPVSPDAVQLDHFIPRSRGEATTGTTRDRHTRAATGCGRTSSP